MNVDLFVSVIVPVYKVEPYLDRCIQSILRQTFKNFELILVDDGSPDRCPVICDKYVDEFPNIIKVIHKENGGLSDARNSGTHLAKGDYVTYIDSDDWVAPGYLETLVKLIVDFNADISVVGLSEVFDNHKGSNYRKLKKEVYCTDGKKALINMLYQSDLDTSACAMLLKKDLVMKYPFPIGKYHEDEYTTYKFYFDSKRVAVSKEKLYFYYQRSNSIMHTLGKASIDELDAADNLVTWCTDNYYEAVQAAKSKKFSDYCQVLLSTDDIKSTNKLIYRRIISYLNEVRDEIINDKKVRRKNKIAAILLIFDNSGKILIRTNYIIKWIQHFQHNCSVA